MDDSLRKVIIDNIDKLVEYTNFSELLEVCLARKILSNVMATNIEYAHLKSETEKHKMLFKKLTKRGPRAYDILVEICRDLKFEEAAKILRTGEYHAQFPERRKPSTQQTKQQIPPENVSPSVDGPVNSKTNDSQVLKLEIYKEETKHNLTTPIKKSTKIHIHHKLESYPMCTKHRGVLFIVNIIDFSLVGEKDRSGAIHDGQNLIYLFREFGFDVFYYEDLQQREFYDLLDELLNSDYVRRAECFVMALMTHGKRRKHNQYVEFLGGAIENVENILSKFSNAACKALSGKPKIFLFPFCRGDTRDIGVYAENESYKIETDGVSMNRKTNKPTLSDIHICYGTVPGFETFREWDSGSWYIRVLCEIWAEHAHDTSFDDLQKLVCQKLGSKRISSVYYQTTCEENWGVFKKLYFNPGYVEEF